MKSLYMNGNQYYFHFNLFKVSAILPDELRQCTRTNFTFNRYPIMTAYGQHHRDFPRITKYLCVTLNHSRVMSKMENVCLVNLHLCPIINNLNVYYWTSSYCIQKFQDKLKFCIGSTDRLATMWAKAKRT